MQKIVFDQNCLILPSVVVGQYSSLNNDSGTKRYIISTPKIQGYFIHKAKGTNVHTSGVCVCVCVLKISVKIYLFCCKTTQGYSE